MRVFGLDLLRALSAVYIIGFWHLLNYTAAITGYQNSFTNKLTCLILGVFVFISGFLIGKGKISFSKKSIFEFYIRKVIRVYPLYLGAIGLYYILELADLNTLSKASVLVSMFFPPAPQTLWFITMLMCFYFIAPFVMLLVKTVKYYQVLILVGLVVCVMYYINHLYLPFDTRFVLYFPAFVFGVLIANREPTRLYRLIFIILAIGSYASSFFVTDENNTSIYLVPMVMFVPYVLFLLVGNLTFSNTVLLKTVTTLSYSSYAMYLFHRPIFSLFLKVFFPKTYLFQLLYLVFVCFLSTIIIGYLIQYVYDKLVSLAFRKLQKPKKTGLAKSTDF